MKQHARRTSNVNPNSCSVRIGRDVSVEMVNESQIVLALELACIVSTLNLLSHQDHRLIGVPDRR